MDADAVLAILAALDAGSVRVRLDGGRAGDALPVSEAIIERSALIAECVAAPEMTRLLEVAREKGRGIHTGVPMLAAQMDLMLRFMGVE